MRRNGRYRSPAWYPTWLDGEWERFLAACPLNRTKKLGKGNAGRAWLWKQAYQLAESQSKMIGTRRMQRLAVPPGEQPPRDALMVREDDGVTYRYDKQKLREAMEGKRSG